MTSVNVDSVCKPTGLKHTVWTLVSRVNDEGRNKFMVSDNETCMEIKIPFSAICVGMNRAKSGDLIHVVTKYDMSPETDAVIVCPQNLYTALKNSLEDSEVRTLYKLITLAKLSRAQQDDIAAVMLSQDINKAKQILPDKLTDFDEMKLKYELMMPYLSSAQISRLNMLFDELNDYGSEFIQKRRPMAYRQLKLIMNINPICASYEEPEYARLMDKLNENIYGMDKAKKLFVETVMASKYKKNRRGVKILLVGRPGVGKSLFAKAVAEACNLPFCCLQFAGLDDPLEIIGDDPSYDKATEGAFIDEYYYAGTSQCVFLLDEIDKSGAKPRDSLPINTLVDVLGDYATFHCRFTEYDFDTGNTIFIATANASETIPEHILNRFDAVLTLDEYTSEDRLKIAKDYMLPALRAQWNADMSFIDITDSALRLIEKSYCADDGMRTMKSMLNSIFSQIMGSDDKPSSCKKVTVDEKDVPKLLDAPDMKNDANTRYRNNREKYSREVSEELISIRKELNKPLIEASQKQHLLKRYDILTKMVKSNRKPISEQDCRRARAKLNKTHYKLDDVKDKICMNLHNAAVLNKSFSGVKLLLVGSPGVGKTSIGRSIAEALGEPFISVGLSGITHPSSIIGTNMSIKNADCGAIIREMHKQNTTHGVLMLNELDKLSRCDGTSLSNTLIDLLDSTPTFTDEYLGVPVDMSDFMIIASANDLSGIEPWVLDRFCVIEVEDYSEADKRTILSKHILPDIVKAYKKSGLKLELTADASKSIVESYCCTSSIRELERAARDVIEKTMYKRSERKTIRITKDDVTDALGAPREMYDMLPEEPGVAMALGVAGSTGISFAIETEVLPDDRGGITITGLAERVMEESAKLAKTYVRLKYAGGRDFGLHISLTHGAIKKDGPSAGVAVLMSILSAYTGQVIPNDVAFTGEIDLKGNVFAVGGLKQKLIAAKKAGCKQVFVPKSCMSSLDDEFLSELPVEVIPVKHVSEVIKSVFKDGMTNTDKGKLKA